MKSRGDSHGPSLNASTLSASTLGASSLKALLATLFRKPVIDRVRVSRSALTHHGALIPVRVAAYGCGTLQLQNGPKLFVWGRINQVFFVRADDAVCTLSFRGLWGRAHTSLPIGPLLSPTPGRAQVGRAASVTPSRAASVPPAYALPAPPPPGAPHVFRAPAARLPASHRTMPSVGHATTPMLPPPRRLAVRGPTGRRRALHLPDPPATRDGESTSTEVII